MGSQGDNSNLNILITGGGLIGGTLALDYSQSLSGTPIVVYEVDPTSAGNLRKELDSKGAINVSVISSRSELEKAARQANIVDHCVPIDAVQDVQEAIATHLQEGTVITNRGSAQSYASASIAQHVDNARGIFHFGIHPVVGRERKPGQPLEIHSGTFKNQTAIMEPLPEGATKAQTEAYERLKFVNETIGFNVKTLPTHIHDQLLGALSHENTAGLQTLVNTREGGVQTGIGATMMRAASGTTAMWSPIHEFNSAAVTASSDIQTTHLKKLEALLSRGEEQSLYDFVAEANEFRSEWDDPDPNVESLDGAIRELGADTGSVELGSQIAVPFAVSIARTLGIKETVQGLETDLAQYGHRYTDLLNSSARDSTLAARYDPKDVAKLLLDNKAEVLQGIAEFTKAHEAVTADVALHAEGSKTSGANLKAHIEGATNIMASEDTPAPRKTGGGQGFADFANPVVAHKDDEDSVDRPEAKKVRPALRSI